MQKQPMSLRILSYEQFPPNLKNLSDAPKKLFYLGVANALTTLLNATHKIAIVGTRKPNQYTKSFVATLASRIARHNGVVISGGAIGVDIIAHTYSFPRTIMFSPSGLDIYYPKSNSKMIKQMMKESLVISEYELGYMPYQYSFLERNRLVIALSDYVIIPQADMRSGSMQSARIANKLKKPVFVLPHRIGESDGTNTLLAQGKAQGIYSIDAFIESIFGASKMMDADDEILAFCATNPSFDEAYERFGDKIYEYELNGKILRESGSIRVIG